MEISKTFLCSILLFSSSAALAANSYTPVITETTHLHSEEGGDDGYVSNTIDEWYGVSQGGENVIANGLEWIRWDVTRNLSVAEALDVFPEYRVATGKEIADLYDSFGLSTDYDGNVEFSWAEQYEKSQKDPNTANRSYFAESYYVTSDNPDEFMGKMGTNYEYLDDYDWSASVQAVFNKDENSSSDELGLASVRLYQRASSSAQSDHTAVAWNNPGDFLSEITGVALVKSAVPEIDVAAAPIGLALLLGLFAINREKKIRA